MHADTGLCLILGGYIAHTVVFPYCGAQQFDHGVWSGGGKQLYINFFRTGQLFMQDSTQIFYVD